MNKKEIEVLSKIYNDPEFQHMRRENRKRQHKIIASYLKNGKSLDVGFAGAPNQFLKNAVGIDLVKISKPENYSEVITYDVNNGLPFPEESFNNIIASEFVEHIENPSFFVRECFRILKPNGRLIITLPNSLYFRRILKGYMCGLDLSTNADHISELTSNSIINILNKNKFRIIEVRGIHFEIPILARWFSFARDIPCKNPILSKSVVYVADKK